MASNTPPTRESIQQVIKDHIDGLSEEQAKFIINIVLISGKVSERTIQAAIELSHTVF